MSVYESLFLLNGLENREKEEIISGFPEPVRFKKNELICSSVTSSFALGFIVSGSAFAVTNNANKVVMKKFLPGMCFGAAALFGGGGKYVSTVAAEQTSEIIFFTEERLTELFKAYPIIAVNYITFLSDKIRFLNEKISVITCQSAEDTVFQYLLCAKNHDGYAVLPKSMTLLAKMLGLGRASLYRSLDRLEQNGYIKRENNEIKVIKNEKID